MHTVERKNQDFRPATPRSAIRDPQSILIACIGNIFLGDDAFGCEVAKLLAERKLPDDVKLVDFGIRSFDLAYALMGGFKTTIFVDASPRGGDPGTIYVIEPDRAQIEAIDTANTPFEPHGMNPMKVLSMVKSLGGSFKRIVVVGCEPQFTGEDREGFMGLSKPVEASLGKAVEVIERLVADILAESAKNGNSVVSFEQKGG
ncbi:MAG: hydrogenase maturation protease [Blastocatellia bacterium]